MSYEKISKALEIFNNHGPSEKDIKKSFDIAMWNGFDACLEMVLNSLDTQESNEIAKFTVWDFISYFREHLIEQANLYKKDG